MLRAPKGRGQLKTEGCGEQRTSEAEAGLQNLPHRDSSDSTFTWSYRDLEEPRESCFFGSIVVVTFRCLFFN